MPSLTIEVGVATARPPRTHAVIRTRYWVPDDSRGAQLDAEVTAALMAMCHPHVVMVTSIRTVARS